MGLMLFSNTGGTNSYLEKTFKDGRMQSRVEGNAKRSDYMRCHRYTIRLHFGLMLGGSCSGAAGAGDLGCVRCKLVIVMGDNETLWKGSGCVFWCVLVINLLFFDVQK